MLLLGQNVTNMPYYLDVIRESLEFSQLDIGNAKMIKSDINQIYSKNERISSYEELKQVVKGIVRRKVDKIKYEKNYNNANSQ